MCCQSNLLQRVFLIALIVISQQAYAVEDPQQQPPQPVSSSGQLTLRATVLLPDGNPAAGAVVHRVTSRAGFPERSVTANASGEIELQDAFLDKELWLHALSQNGRSQAIVRVPDSAVRMHLSKPLTITLEPATPHQVIVTAGGQPVEGAHILASGGIFFKLAGITDADGIARLWHPTAAEIKNVVAWHPRHGVNGVRNQPATSVGTRTKLSLLASQPHVIRILDTKGTPVTGHTIGATVMLTGGEVILAEQIHASRKTSDENGEVRFDWFPAEGLKHVSVDLVNRVWVKDETDLSQVREGRTTIHVRKRIPIKGRVVLPEVADAQGLLVTGRGFSPGISGGDIPRARTRRDGTFTMDVPHGYGLLLGVSDQQWTSDVWTGEILPFEGARQNELVLQAYPAVPMEIHVTRGSARQPIASARVSVSRRGSMDFIVAGRPARMNAGVSTTLHTDDNGIARIGVGLGEIRLQLSSGDWREEKTIHVTSNEPVRVDFQRD